MGYAVYEDPNAPGRWAGYAVPAECDWPDCHECIDRGLGWKCDEHAEFEGGCGLFFCSRHEHRFDEHAGIEPKPDTAEWMRHMLTDDSWEQWRAEHPERVEAMRALLEPESGDDQ